MSSLLRSLEEKLLEYYPEVNIPLIRKAFDFAEKKHNGQFRSSGEAYITHPVGVAIILSELRLDLDSIITGLLHDTVEDTSASFDEIEKLFGSSIAELVDGVTKISRIKFKTSQERQAENFRKMVIAMAKDLRVILVKLADRTHNMRTLEHLAESKQRIIAQETLDIYAPLANRLGISWMKAELEDLCLRYLKPEVYYRLAQHIKKKKKEREEYIEKVQKLVVELLKEYSISGEVTGRSKHFYSIYKKMEKRSVDFEQIQDIVAFRIVLDNITECYKALGVIHSSFKPVQGRFKDYIAMPKPNNYQSLHTTVIGPYGERVEIQIRTHEMHNIATSGIAAHWKYKEGRADSSDTHHMDWLNRLMESQKSLSDPTEFLESVKIDLYQGDVFVFTPKGEVKEFPQGSTPLDFAYSIHTDVGNQCVGAKVNGNIVPLKYRLKSGDTIEIITSNYQKPSKDWLKLVKSSKAISRIRAYLKQEERQKALELGKEIFERDARRHKTSLARIKKAGNFVRGLKELGFKSADDLFVAIGYGKVITREVLQKVIPEIDDNKPNEKKAPSFLQKIISTAANRTDARNAVMVDGIDDVLIRFARCCHPIPGDQIVGFITRGRGVTVHNVACTKIMESGNERKIDVDWNMGLAKGTTGKFKRAVRIKVVCGDTPGLLATMSQTISAQEVNISQATIRTTKDKKAACIFEIMVIDLQQLNKVISALESHPGIIRVERLKN